MTFHLKAVSSFSSFLISFISSFKSERLLDNHRPCSTSVASVCSVPILLYYTTVILVFLSLLLMHDGNDWFYHQRAGLFLFLAFACVAYFYQHLKLSLCVAMLYCLVSAIYSGVARDNQLSAMGVSALVVQRSVLLGSMGMLMAWFVCVSEAIPRKALETGFILFGIILMIHYSCLRGYFATDGILMTPTLEATLLALETPLAFKKSPILGCLFILFTIIMGGRTAAACLIAMGWAVVFMRHRKVGILIAVLSVAALSMLIVSGNIALLLGQKMGQHRLEIWAIVYDWWKNSEYIWFGTGSGTAYTLIPSIGRKYGMGEFQFFYLHNEYLSCLFELGLAGSSLIALSITHGFYLCVKNMDLRGISFICSMMAASISMFPWRHDTIMLLCVLEASRIYKKTLL